MHKVAIYLEICVPITQSQASVVFCADHFKTIHHVYKHEIVFHNLLRAPCKGVMRKACRASDAWREKMLSRSLSNTDTVAV